MAEFLALRAGWGPICPNQRVVTTRDRLTARWSLEEAAQGLKDGESCNSQCQQQRHNDDGRDRPGGDLDLLLEDVRFVHQPILTQADMPARAAFHPCADSVPSAVCRHWDNSPPS